MKKNKLSLNSFTVQSFVTSVETLTAATAKGGQQCHTEEFCSHQTPECEEDSICCCATDIGCTLGMAACPTHPAICP